MKKTLQFKTQGTCSRMIEVSVEDGIVSSCKFVGGCAGNTQGVSALVVGMPVEEAISRMKGIRCGLKSTSCPDQLSRALEKLIASED